MDDLKKKILDILFKITDFLDSISEKIFEQTKIKIDLKLILGGAIGIIIVAILVKSFLSYVFGQL